MANLKTNTTTIQNILDTVNALPDGEEIDLSQYMTKNNPTGTGSFSLNRKADTTVANYSVAVGQDTQARGWASFAEGKETEAATDFSHAEGLDTYANGDCAHAEGRSTEASIYAHAEGEGSHASGESSHAEGAYSTSEGMGSHAEGVRTLASGQCSHAEGCYTTASGEYSHAEGYGTKAECNYSHAEGYNTTVSGYGYGGHAEGQGTFATKENAHAEGTSTTASGESSHSEGSNTTASGDYSHAEGYYTTASGHHSHAAGYYTTALHNQYVIGHYNSSGDFGGPSDTIGDAFIIGNGSSSSATANAFRVTYAGKAYGLSSYGTSGADYAEFFEWQDLNPNGEDRRGYFVTLDGEKIKIAEPNDYILGIVSALPAIIGNGDEGWRGRYILDDFGAFITEEFEYEEEVFDEETGEKITITKIGTKYKENPDYDPTLPYIQREDRPEWDTVGMMGALAVRDDGTCQVNGYCRVANGGIATASESGYRVIKRVNENIIKVIFK